MCVYTQIAQNGHQLFIDGISISYDYDIGQAYAKGDPWHGSRDRRPLPPMHRTMGPIAIPAWPMSWAKGIKMGEITGSWDAQKQTQTGIHEKRNTREDI